MTETRLMTSRRLLPPGDITADSHEPPQNRAEDYFKRYVPRGLIRLLGAENIRDIDVGQHAECKVTIVFMDIRNFTTISEGLSSEETFELINSFLDLAVPVIESRGGIIDKFIGDAIMAIFPEDADEALLAVREILTGIPGLRLPAAAPGPISVGAGINTGFVMVGALGNHQRMEVTIVGDSVNLASRLEYLNKTYGTSCVISEATLNSLELPDQFSLRMIDRIRVKGKVRPQSIYELIDVYPEDKKQRIQSTAEAFENALANFHMNNVDSAQQHLRECIATSPDDHVAQLYIDRCEQYLGGGKLGSLSMSTREVEWSDDFNVQISKVDHQHQELLENVNKVVRLVSAEEQEGLAEVLDFLMDWLINHTTGLDRHMGKRLVQAGYSE